jgi:hypothetical protein
MATTWMLVTPACTVHCSSEPVDVKVVVTVAADASSWASAQVSA